MSKKILVVEDEMIIGLGIEADLTDAGYTVIGSFTRCDDALRWLAEETPDAAVLDFRLAEGTSEPIAKTLIERGVPFIMLTGSGANDLPETMIKAPRIAKPGDMSHLPGLLAMALTTRSTDQA